MHLLLHRAGLADPARVEALAEVLDFGLGQGLELTIPDLCGIPPCFLPAR